MSRDSEGPTNLKSRNNTIYEKRTKLFILRILPLGIAVLSTCAAFLGFLTPFKVISCGKFLASSYCYWLHFDTADSTPVLWGQDNK